VKTKYTNVIKNYVKISKKHSLCFSLSFYIFLTLHFELFILVLGYSVAALFVYATREWKLVSVDNTVFDYV
jgi:hypothetical protein